MISDSKLNSSGENLWTQLQVYIDIKTYRQLVQVLKHLFLKDALEKKESSSNGFPV